MQLPIHTTDLQIEYSAGSLTVPERVRFRYKLEGLDRDWQDVGTRREALYTNLGPGRYTFRVIASNNDGVWNDTGASHRVRDRAGVLPDLVVLRVVRARVRRRCSRRCTECECARSRRRSAARLEARLAERERIARELHDTLLQGMQGLIWRFQAATDRIPHGRARAAADGAVARSRGPVARREPRQSEGSAPDARETSGSGPGARGGGRAARAAAQPPKFRVSVQGTGRELHPIVREEDPPDRPRGAGQRVPARACGEHRSRADLRRRGAATSGSATMDKASTPRFSMQAESRATSASSACASGRRSSARSSKSGASPEPARK